MGKVGVAESLLVQIWKRQLVDEQKLATASGDGVRVLYPGRENRDSGPDFLGAIIATAGGRLLRGDIELHSRASDWRNHGHHRDPGYNGVILQVAWDGDEEAVLENGGVAPTLCLRSCLSGSLDQVRHWANVPLVPTEPCHRAVQRLGTGELGRLLDEAGDERFRVKAGRFTAKLDDEAPSQVLYQGIMEALGYAKNREPFEELARRLHISVLEACCRGKSHHERVSVLRSLLLYTAGLLPARSGQHPEHVRHCLGGGETMNPSCWRLFRVRPGNHPFTRLVGAAHLLARFMEDGGPVECVLGWIGASVSGAGRLEAGFVVRAAEPCSRGERTLIGQGRAREIVVNVALPFAYAWAQVTSHSELMERVMALYGSCPKAEESEVTRELSGLLLDSGPPGPVNSARRQQGLIHLARSFCRQRRCADCPVSARLHSVALAC